MNLFNMFNCRVLESKGEPQWNVLDGIWRNWWFLIIWFAELNMQIFMVGYAGFGKVFQTTPLTLGMHITALVLGLGSLGVSAIVKKTPEDLLKYFPELAENEEEAKLPGALQDQFERSKTAMLMDD